MMILELVHNVALLVALSVGLQMLSQRVEKHTGAYQWTAGLLFGAVGVVGMMTPLEFAPGVIYDGRSIVLSLAGFLEGPLPALVASVICAAYRLHLGGAGAPVGVSVIVESAALGVCLYYLRRRDERWGGPVAILSFGVIVHAIMLALQFLVPGNLGWEVLRQIGPSVLFFYPLGFLVVAWVFLEGERRREMARQLRIREERYRSLFENRNAIMLITSPETGDILDANPGACAFYGWTRAELRSKNIADLNTSPEERIRTEMAAARESRKHHFFFQHRLSDGSLREVEVFTSPLRVDGRDVIYSIVHDITERKRSDEALRLSEERFRSVVEGAPDAIFVQTDRRFAYVNDTCVALLHAERAEDLLGQPVYERFHARDHEQIAERIRRLNELRAPVDLQVETMVALDGTLVPVEVTAVPFHFEGSNGALVFARDVRQRLKAESDLEASEARFRRAVENAPSPVIIYAEGGEVITLSRAWSDITGYELADIPTIGDWTRLAYGERAEEAAAIISKNYSLTGPKHEGEFEITCKDGSKRTWDFSSNPLGALPDGRRVAISMAADVTERKRAESALAESEHRYRTLYENAPVGIFTTTSQGKAVAVNSVMAHLLGLGTREEALDRYTDLAPQLYVHPEQRDAFVRELRERGHVSGFEYEARTADGRTVWLGMNARVSETLDDGTFLIEGFTSDITERKCAEQELAERERQLATLMANLPGMAYRCYADRDWTMLFVSEGAEGLTGYRVEDLELNARVSYARLIHPDDEARVWEAVKEAIEAGEPFLVEYRILHASGEERWVWEQGRAVDTTVETPILEGFIADVTESRRAAEVARESDERLRDLLDRISYIPVQGCDEDLRVIYWNPASTQVFGYRQEEALGRPLHELIVPENMRTLAAGNIRRLLEGGPDIASSELVLQDRHGNDVPVYTSILVHVTARGERQVLCVQVDLRALRRAEEQLLRLGTAIDQAGEVVVITDPQGTIQYVNPAFEKVTGYRAAEVIGQNPRILQSGEHDAAFYASLWSTLKRGETWQGRFVNKRKDGTLYTEEATISPVRDESGAVVNYVGVKSDITAQLDLEEQYRQAQKMEAVGQLAGGVAHDFNNILQGILGYSQILVDVAEETGAPSQELQEIHQGAQRAASLTRQLLAFSRRQVMRPVVLNLNEVIDGFLNMLKRLIGEHINLAWLPGNHLGAIYADPGMMEQVVMNLCVNARDAMPMGGELSIETRNVKIDSAYCAEHVWAQPGRFVLLSVTDTGSGIERDALDRIFEPFFTTKSEGKGTGLGLSTVYGIVKQHDGMVNTYSEVGKGTTFKVYIPICEQRAATIGPMIEGAVKGGAETILLAEDDELVRNLARTILTRAGYTVLTANDGLEAVEVFQQHQDEVALLVFDVVMPNLDGHLAFDRIRAMRPNIQAVFASGYSENAIHTNFVLHEGLQLLPKPYSSSALLRAVRSALDEGEKGDG